MSINSLPPVPRRARPAGSLPSINAVPAPALPDPNVITEYLMIKLEHNLQDGITNVSFESQGFDAENDEIVVDVLNTAAAVFDYVLVAEEDVEYVDIDDED